jgi:hypothetical protein
MDGAGQGNLLITTVPYVHPLRHSETQPLRAWVARGNTLLVLAGLSDTPEWSKVQDPGFMTSIEAMTGLTFIQDFAKVAENGEASEPAREKAPTEGSAAEAENALRNDEPRRYELRPNGAHPLLKGVNLVSALSEYPSAKWRAALGPDRLLLELAHDPATQTPVLWLLRCGEGRILVSGYGSVFTNKLLASDDNARLLANIVRWSVAPGGRILIDDAHQGVVAFYDPDAFFGDKRLHASLWWLLGLWLVFVLGPRSFRVGSEGWRPLDVASFVRATGGFLAQVLRPAAAAQQLFANFFNELRRRCGLPTDGAPLWDWLSAQAAVSPDDLAQLRKLHARAVRGSRVDLQRLQTLLARTRANLR